jgi:hypothetical protein
LPQPEPLGSQKSQRRKPKTVCLLLPVCITLSNPIFANFFQTTTTKQRFRYTTSFFLQKKYLPGHQNVKKKKERI